MKNSVLVALACVGLVAGCGEKSSQPSMEQSVAHVVAAQEDAKAKAHAEENMKKLKAKAEADAKAAREKAFADLLVVPDGAPTDLDDACLAMSSAYDTFMTKRLTGTEGARWNAIKERDLEHAREQCQGDGNVKVAACQAHALGNAPQGFGESDATRILIGCQEKIAGTAPRTAAK